MLPGFFVIQRQPGAASAATVGRTRRSCVTREKEWEMPQFDATIKHIKEGAKGLTVSAAVKNIEGWEATLEKLEVSGVKTIIKDLESLKKHLHAQELDGEAIRKLVVKLGKETVNIAGKTEGAKAEKVKALGEALTQAAEHAEADV
jgi:hypothetical protein